MRPAQVWMRQNRVNEYENNINFFFVIFIEKNCPSWWTNDSPVDGIKTQRTLLISWEIYNKIFSSSCSCTFTRTNAFLFSHFIRTVINIFMNFVRHFFLGFSFCRARFSIFVDEFVGRYNSSIRFSNLLLFDRAKAKNFKLHFFVNLWCPLRFGKWETQKQWNILHIYAIPWSY